MLVLCLQALSCSTQRALQPFEESGAVWPQPPAPARIQWVGEFSTPSDLGINPSLWSRLLRLTTGPAKNALVRPMAVAVDEVANIIYVADPGAGCVHRYNLGAGAYRQLRPSGDVPLLSPVGLAISPDGRVFVSDSQQARLFVAAREDRDLTLLQVDGELQRPTGIAWDSDAQQLLVVDTAAQSILRMSPSGEILATYGNRGVEAGTLNYPTYLWQTRNRDLLVSDSLNFRIQRLSPEGRMLGQFGEAGDATGTLSRPKGVSADSFGSIYVVDALFHSLHIFNEDGQFLLAVGEMGQQAGQFWLPTGLFVDRNNMIYVADTHNRRIQVFRYVGDAS
jgi:sugar lactone lactonase YvrE